MFVGPNINPACPPAGYYHEVQHSVSENLAVPEADHGSDSAVVGDVAGEQVVGADATDDASCDSGQVSDTRSVGKPKTGVYLYYI